MCNEITQTVCVVTEPTVRIYNKLSFNTTYMCNALTQTVCVVTEPTVRIYNKLSFNTTYMCNALTQECNYHYIYSTIEPIVAYVCI